MDRTYLTIGKLEASIIDIDVVLPEHEEGKPYDFGFAYNISKKIKGKKTYAICYYMRIFDEPGVQLFNGNTLYPHRIAYDDLIKVEKPGVIAFDDKAKDVFVTVIHDDQEGINPLIYVESLFDTLEDDINALNLNGQPYVYIIPLQLRPRVVGMSIVSR
ncbi:hypothetical protein [Flavobacterium sp.]|uniref:hypothetical protein n=1 Tax=Flavobacterium sp. TaxID=239 RepID=UPI00286BFCA5|nr:hypothetical protein [Flavobacterium sp.]